MNPTWLFVAAVYAAAVALARRCGAAMPWRVALLFYLLALGFLLRPMTGPAVNVHADILKTLAPWNFLTEDRSVANGMMNDVPLQEVPWAHAVRESWKAGSAPLWNATTACGAPLLANAQSAALSPLRIVALPLGLGHSMTAEAAMKLLIALTLMFLYCRRRWSEEASIVAAVSFGFCGFLFVWLHFPAATTACLLPGVFLLIDLLVEKTTYLRFTTAAVLWAVILFGGHPETAAHMFLAALLYLAWLRPRIRSVFTLAAAMLVATLLAAPYLASFGDAVTKSRRFHNVRAAPIGETALPYSDWKAAVPLLQPLFFGPIDKPWGPTEADALTAFAGVLGVASWLAMGWYILATKSWRSTEAFFALLALVVTGVIFEWPGFSEAMHLLIPIGAHARLRFLLAFALAFQAAAAIDRSRTHRAPLVVALGVVAIALVAIFTGIEFPPAVRDRRAHALMLAIPALAVLASCAAMLLFRTRAATAVFIAAVVAEMWTAGRGFNPPASETLLYPRTPIIARLEQLRVAGREPFRIVGYGAMLFPNIATVYGFEDIRVHDPMAGNRYLEFLAQTSSFDPTEYFGMWGDIDSPVLDFLNVRYLAVDPNVDVADRARYRLVYEGPDGRIFENTSVLPRFYAPRNVVIEFRDEEFRWRLRGMKDKWAHTALLDELELENQQMHDDFFNPRPDDAPTASVSIVEASDTAYRISADAPRYTLVASSIPWWPGWKIERNGQRIEPIRVNHAFIGFAVPPGQSEIRIRYAPSTWFWGSAVSIATAIALLAIGICGSAARGRSCPPAPVEERAPRAASLRAG